MLKKLLVLFLSISLVVSTILFTGTVANGIAGIDDVLWDFQDSTTQGWFSDISIAVEGVGSTKALRLNHMYSDKKQQTWWDAASIKLTDKRDLSEYSAVVYDLILDPSAIDGYGYFNCRVSVSTQGWAEYITFEPTHVYYTQYEEGDTEYVKVKCRAAIPNNIGIIEQMTIWLVGASIDYNKAIYVDNIGFSTKDVNENDADKFVLDEKSPVEKNGKLRLIGTNLCNEKGEPVQLRGVSYGMMMSHVQQVTHASMQAFLYDWKCDVLRFSVDIGQEYYYNGTQEDKDYVSKAIDYAIELGLYVVLDWHVLTPGNPNDPTYANAEDFFNYFSEKYAHVPNIIYEVCNEPNGANVTWSRDIKPYSEKMISVIRNNSPDSIIVVGTPTWSQDVNAVADDPIDAKNIMYTLHFYAGTHKQSLRDKAKYALNKGLAIFVTEWGTTMHTGADGLFFNESDIWLNFMDDNNISWTNWCFLNTSSESSLLKTMTSEKAEDGLTVKKIVSIIPQNISSEGYRYWTDNELTDSAVYVRKAMRDAYVKNTDFSVNAKVNYDSGKVKVIADTIGANGVVEYSFYILKDGNINYVREKTRLAEFDYKLMQGGDYVVLVYAIDSLGYVTSYSTKLYV